MISAPNQIDYANQATPVAGEDAYRTAILCGSIPLVLGVSILLAFYATGILLLTFGGLAVIVIGICLVGFGMKSLRQFRRQRLIEGRLSIRDARRFWLALFLLLSNFPAAWICAVIGARLVAPWL